MYDRLTVQTEVAYKREQLARSASPKKGRSGSLTRIPFVGDHVNRRVR